MADIELVIKIPEESYEYWKKHKYEYVLSEAIADGVVLPKGHGRLIDADWVLNRMVNADADTLPRTPSEHYAWNFAQSLLTQTPAIIEADRGEE